MSNDRQYRPESDQPQMDQPQMDQPQKDQPQGNEPQMAWSQKDQLLLDRFLDGALTDDEQRACQRRLEAEPQLRWCLRQRQELRRGFAAGRRNAFAAPAGFAAGVVAAARRLPVLDRSDTDGAIIRYCRRLLIAAAVIFAVSALWQSKLFHDGGDGLLQASPDEQQSIIDALDAGILGRQGEASSK